jgi:hypothetical protein
MPLCLRRPTIAIMNDQRGDFMVPFIRVTVAQGYRFVTEIPAA